VSLPERSNLHTHWFQNTKSHVPCNCQY